jgi:hypothetical protein
MGLPLSPSQLAKYASRLQGQRLFLFFREWQIKRAIRKLLQDGSAKALKALEEGSKTGLLARPPYQGLLTNTLANKPGSEPLIQTSDCLESGTSTARIGHKIKAGRNTDSASQDISPIATSAIVSGTNPLEACETFTKSENPFQLLQSRLAGLIPTSTYQEELRQTVHADSNRCLLQQICELWSSSSQPYKQLLTELIEFIELLPLKPLQLRTDVALGCRLERHLSDDGVEIAEYLVSRTQLEKSKSAVIRAVRRVRNDELKAEICRIWHERHKVQEYDPGFEEVLCALQYLPTEPIERRVLIALTCKKPHLLALEKSEVLTCLLPLIENKSLGSQAQSAIALLQDPETLEALNKTEKTIPPTETSTASSIHGRINISDNEKQICFEANTSDIELLLERREVNQELMPSNPDCPTEVEAPDKDDQSLEESALNREEPAIDVARRGLSRFTGDTGIAECGHDNIQDLHYPWVEKLDLYVRLGHQERLRIISEIARSDRSIDDWIDELLYEGESFLSEENPAPHLPDSEWFDDVSYAPSGASSNALNSFQPLPIAPKSLTRGAHNKIVADFEHGFEPSISGVDTTGKLETTAETTGQTEFFPFIYKTKQDILRITNCHPSALKQAAKKLRCKAPFSLIEADRLAYALTGDASIHRVYKRRLRELELLGNRTDADEY